MSVSRGKTRTIGPTSPSRAVVGPDRVPILHLALRIGLIGLALASLGGCAEAGGDLGRPRASVWQGLPVPANRPVVALTDEEREMENRIWRFLVAPHADRWAWRGSIEQQARLMNPPDKAPPPADAYARLLLAQPFASSHVRYRAIAADIRTDIALLPQTFAAICAVDEIDRRRAIAANDVRGLDPVRVKAVLVQMQQNDNRTAWFVEALVLRYTAYSTALDILLVETPHEEARIVDAELSTLSIWLERAHRGDWCGSVPVTAAPGTPADAAALAARGKSGLLGPIELEN